MRKCWMSLVALLLGLQLAIPSALAQQAELRAEEGPHYVDVPLRLQVIAEGFEESPQPEVEVEDPAGGRLELTGISPSVSSSIQIINGRMSQSKRVRFVFEYQLLVDRPGDQVVGPFRVSQNGKEATTGRLRLEIGEIQVSDQQRLRLVLPEAPLIVGQRVPVRLEWWAPVDTKGKLFNPRLSVPFFDRLDAFRFSDIPDPDADLALTVDTATGPVEMQATTRVERADGESYLVRTITRQLTPLKAGDYEIAPASLVVDEAVRWRRTFFGERIPTHAQKRRAVDEPRSLLVRDLPAEGRPESFTGTVGGGYRLEVAADRSVVQVGDPIRLTLTLQGDAAVETAVLPPLTADNGLSVRDFRVPQDKAAGVYVEGAKRFEVTVRALHQGVTEIPPLAFSWYDPEQKEYQTTRSEPVALSVRPAQVVTAEDVVNGMADEAQETEQAQGDKAADARHQPAVEAMPADVTASARRQISLTGADLAIATDVDVLLQPNGSLLTSVGVQAGAYGLGLLAMVLAFVARRHAMADPAELARVRALREQRATVVRARILTEATDGLRRMVSTAGIRPSVELDDFLAECDTQVYAPGGASRTLDESTRARALALADQMLRENVR